MLELIEKPIVAVPGSTRHEPGIASRPSSSETSATPSEISIGTLPHPRLRLRGPLRAEVRREGDAVGVWSSDLEELGIGPHLSAAIEDFQRSVIELYFTLEADQNRLGPGLTTLWQRLQEMIDVRP